MLVREFIISSTNVYHSHCTVTLPYEILYKRKRYWTGFEKQIGEF